MNLKRGEYQNERPEVKELDRAAKRKKVKYQLPEYWSRVNAC